MAVDAIIQAAVFGHLEILKELEVRIGRSGWREALNLQPSVNGLTALHDAVLRASTAGPQQLERYLSQIRWFTNIGARSDIEDFAGRTQASIACDLPNAERRGRILDALGLNARESISRPIGSRKEVDSTCRVRFIHYRRRPPARSKLDSVASKDGVTTTR